MTLLEKLYSINEPDLVKTVGLLPVGSANTVDEFFDSFIQPRLPSEAVIKSWHKLLIEYCDELDNLSCAVRYGNSGSKGASLCGETGYLKLRRGWLTQNIDDSFEYFYADNFLAAFICKMAIDGYCPKDVNELRSVFSSHKFPYGFGYFVDKKYEAAACVIPIAHEPGFLGNYKISHIFNSGKNYVVDGVKYKEIKQLSEKFFDIGYRNQWLSESDHIRKIHISEKEKRVIAACFLRFAHPFNYFLTPSKKKHSCSASIKISDIGEYQPVVEKVKDYIRTTYPAEYKEFLDRIMWYDDPIDSSKPDIINITYGNPAAKKLPSKPKATTPTAAPIPAVSTKGGGKSSGVGQRMKKRFMDLLSSGKLSAAQLNDLMDKNYCSKAFGISFPVVVLVTDDNGHCYKKDIVADKYLITREWLVKHEPRVEDWFSTIGF